MNIPWEITLRRASIIAIAMAGCLGGVACDRGEERSRPVPAAPAAATEPPAQPPTPATPSADSSPASALVSQPAPPPLTPSPAPPVLTEREKIERLLDALAGCEAKFIRNGEEFSGADAAAHLRRKLKSVGDRIKTAAQFIEHLASKSSASGKPYQVKTTDGVVHLAGDWFTTLLESIETNSPKAEPTPAP